MFFAAKDIEGRNINVKQGYILPRVWQSASAVRALTEQFGPCTEYVNLEEINIYHVLSEVKNDKKNIDSTARRRRSNRNGAA